MIPPLFEPLVEALWILLPSLITSTVTFWLRPRFTALGSRHRDARGTHFRFIVHYADNAEIEKPLVVKVAIRGNGCMTRVPELLAGPEAGPCDAVPPTEGAPAYSFEIARARPRSTWVVTCDTDGREANVTVEVAGRMAPVAAREVQSREGWGKLEAAVRGLAWLLGTIAVAVAGYLLVSLERLQPYNPARWIDRDPSRPLFVNRPLPFPWDFVIGALGVVSIIAVYYVCMPRRRLPLAHGYLGWERPPSNRGGRSR